MSPHRASTLDASSGAFYYPPRTYDATVPQPSSSAQSHMHAVSRPSSRHQSPTASEGGTKKRHICTTCDRAFTTSGHLARHARIHTGERNHKCPFPGCETRCSRQDNLQQHYRIHLSPGSRRSSSSATRQAIARAISADAHPTIPSNRRPTLPGVSSISGLVRPQSPPTDPPSLEQAHPKPPPPLRQHQLSPPPDSPPPLTQATLPATVQPPPMSDSSSSRSSSSPDIQYPELVQAHVSTSATNALGLAVQSQPYRSGPTSYQEQSQSANYPYVAPSPIPPPVIAANVELHGMNGTPYAYTQDFDAQVISHGNSPVQHHHHSMPSASSSPSMPAQLALPSRHSISHISHPQPHVYTDAHSSSAGNSPLSSTGSSSHHSHSQDAGPMGSAYPMFHGGAYRGGSGSTYRSELVQGGYTPGLAAQCADSPPPVLAPIQQDERMGGRAQQQQQHHVQEYLHHPQPSNTYQYYQSGLSALNHGNWKAEYTMRERGAIVQ